MEWNMDNVNEIDLFQKSEPSLGFEPRRRDVSSSIQDFLELESRNLPTEVSGADYDLERAYDATVRNRWKNFLPVFLWMLASFVFVLLISVTIVTIVNKQNSNIPVEVQHFDSLNLRNLLDLVGKTQAQIDEESAKKNNLELERQNIVDLAEAEKKSALETLDSMNISKSEKTSRRAEIDEKYNERMSEVKEIDGEIAKSEKQIQFLQRQLAEYDTVKVEQARKQQALLDSEKQLRQIEKKQLTDDYEGKLSSLRTEMEEMQEADLKRQEEAVNFVINQYDPTFATDFRLKDLISKYANRAVIYTGSTSALSLDASERFQEALKNQKSYYSDMDSLLQRFSRIPQKNAIPKLASSMQRMANSAGNEFAEAAVAEVNGLLSQKAELENSVTTLTEEKDAAVSERDSLAGERDSLISERDEIIKNRDELKAANDELSLFKANVAEETGKISAELASVSAEKEALLAEKNSLVAERDSLISERNSWGGNEEIVAARDKAVADLSAVTQEKERLASENEKLVKEKNDLNEKYKKLLSERESSSQSFQSSQASSSQSATSSSASDKEVVALEKENRSLKSTNESLSAKNGQYSALLQSLCTKNGTLTHGFVVTVKNNKRVQIYVENSAFKKYAPIATSGELVPIAILHDGKTIAYGKLAVDGDTTYMIKGGESDQAAVAAVVKFDGTNAYNQISAGDEIRIMK